VALERRVASTHIFFVLVVGALQASSSAAVAVDADNAGTNEVGRLQGVCIQLHCSFSVLFMFAV